jgi:hypothetical protein
MSHYVKAKIETAIQFPYAMPAMLALNSFVLLAFEQHFGIPDWIKSAAAIFLAF